MSLRLTITIWIAVAIVVASLPTNARDSRHGGRTGDSDHPGRVLVLDGSPVHNVGDLHLHTSNWGAFGSQPGSSNPFSGAPSGEWPAGTGIEHVYTGGLWVGAIKNGVPAVSTAAFDTEFRPTADPLDVVYYSSEGAPGGGRPPNALGDDDSDGSIDEDPLDGHDNDLDGSIDEDYAAISDQMLARWYVDNTAAAIATYPQHNPLNIEVREESYQWEDDGYDDFVGFSYTITNIGTDVLENVFIGVFLDGDIGNRNTPDYWLNDAAGFFRSPAVCTPHGPYSVDFAYMYDSNDSSADAAFFGVLLLGHLIDPFGQVAPDKVAFSTYANFSGSQPYEEGGDPTNDFERYELMSSQTIERGSTIPRDYRILAVVGPFAALHPGESLPFSMALVATPKTDILLNTIAAKRVYEGRWIDGDADPFTGVKGRETGLPGPIQGVVIDRCDPPFDIPINWNSRDPVYVNNDCEREVFYRLGCGYADADSVLYQTGVEGRETQVHWLLPEFALPVFITSFDVRVNEFSAELWWEIYSDEEINGFRVYRASQDGSMSTTPVASDSRSFVDHDIEPGQEYRYVLAAVKADGSEVLSQPKTVRVGAWALELKPNYPNPFNPTTTISYTLPHEDHVTLGVYTVSGKLVRILIDGKQPAGAATASWDGRGASGQALSSGVYFYRLKAGKTVLKRKMVLLK